jgi:Histidine kinase-, DNA gyrase B-, and HSP90-like ATPase
MGGNTMRTPADIRVISHVGRDLLQSAAVFKHEWLVVWEYVANGLQYVEPGTASVVKVTVDNRNKNISISDNGRGMSRDDLQNFFIMHGENIDRKQGRTGRGYFGTGKSAAFGIASTLRVTTIKDKRRCAVELHRADVEAVSSGAPIPVHILEQNTPTDKPNGTTVEIEEIHLRSIDINQIVKYIERHIARWPRATVLVNSHQCEFVQPVFSSEFTFEPTDEPFRSAIPNSKLIVRVARAPLEESQQGVAISSQGVWYETTLAGSERKELSQYIFGEFDVPTLAHDASPISAFDLSRSMLLNRSNEQVQRIIAFIGIHVEHVRKILVESERKRRATEDARKLAREASEIARILNTDFDAFRYRLAKVLKTSAVGGKDDMSSTGQISGDEDILRPGEELPATAVQETGETGHGAGEGLNGHNPPSNASILEAAAEADSTRRADKKIGGPTRRPKGGFSVRFENLGRDDDRAKYVRDERTIVINLDHPEIAEALAGGNVEDVAFRRLSYEVAFTEYALALSQEMAQAGHFMDVFEPLTEARYTLNRIARQAAHLYRMGPGLKL